ncbi:hypothetical protein L9F63_027708, partial [Diploptera punctata]
MLPIMAAGLGSILFAISIDKTELNQPSGTHCDSEPLVPSFTRSEPVIAASDSDSNSKKKPDHRRRKRVPAHIISFDDDDLTDQQLTDDKTDNNSASTKEELHNPVNVEPCDSSTAGSESPRPDNSERPSQLSLNQQRSLTPSKLVDVPDRSKDNPHVGELIPVSITDEAHSEEDSLSVPSYSEARQDGAPPHWSNEVHEVREAVMSLLARKEELQAETRSLKRLLEQAHEESSELRAELVESNRQHHEKGERLESRIQALVRENELLKHQLRKYVGAVQMLKRDGTQAHEALATREYEKKLIQVAEMHGELMEFNDRLHRLLQQKDVALRRLREELVDLRGPLPDDVATSDDDLTARALVNIWIPSAFLTGGSSDVHHVYQVYIRIRDDEWNIYRRYAQFYSLHKELKKQDAVVSTFDFPPKKTLGNKDARFVEERRRRLQHYLRTFAGEEEIIQIMGVT